MGFLAGKKILVTGLLSPRSIAYGVAAAVRVNAVSAGPIRTLVAGVGDPFEEKAGALAV